MVHATGLLPAMGKIRSALRRDLRILAYHRVRDVPAPEQFEFDLELISASAAQFRAQVSWIRQHFQPLRLVDVLHEIEAGRPLPPNALVVTFDDGYDDNYRVAFPILRDVGIPATFFVSTGHIDSGLPYRYDWLVHMLCLTSAPRLLAPELGIDEALPAGQGGRRLLATRLLDRMKSLDDAAQWALITRLEQEWAMPAVPHPDCRPLSWDQLREMQAAGMEIGGHGVTHRMLAKLPRVEMEAELHDSKAALDRELPEPALTLSYPVGGNDSVNAEVTSIARAAGFRLGCTYVAGTSRVGPDSFLIPRLPVERTMGNEFFAAMTALPELFTYRSRLRDG